MKCHWFLLVPILLCSLTLAQQKMTSPGSSRRAFSLDDCINEFSPAQIESTNVGYQYWFVGKDFLDGRTLKLSVVKPRMATHAPHKHPEDELFFVLEGKAELYLNGKTRVAEPYTSFYCPPNSEHGIRNVGDTILKYLVMKKYETK